MYGAIFGDIIGSRFEFDRGGKTKDFELFTEGSNFTDDTAMTIAVGEGLLKAGKNATVDEIRRAVTESMMDWGNRYPDAGYGGRFWNWLFSGRKPEPYGSYGNGSAMRVSAAGWLYDSLERTREVARATAEVTHNHPEGIKGAECTAAVMYLARTGVPKNEIREYVIREFGYDLSETLDQLRLRHRHVESCQDSLPKALVSFFEGNSYEDVVRNAVSLGGDTDTLAAIAGAMAEACYGMPIIIMAEGKAYLPGDMLAVLDNFDIVLGRKSGNASEEDEKNRPIKDAIAGLRKNFHREGFMDLMNFLIIRMLEDGRVSAPMEDLNHVADRLNPEELKCGDVLPGSEGLQLRLNLMQDGSGKLWVPFFTDEDELLKDRTAQVSCSVDICSLLKRGLEADVEGVVINPFGEPLMLPKEILKETMDFYEQKVLPRKAVS